MEMENLYLAPEVDIIEVAVEKGFNGSNDPTIDEGGTGGFPF